MSARKAKTSRPEKPAGAASGRGARSARTRDRILEVATDLIARRGYSGTSISALSRASGVLPATIYWHFENKEGLLAAVVERSANEWLLGAPGAMSDGGPPGVEPDPAEVDARNQEGFRNLFEKQAQFYRVLLLVSLERRDAGGPPLAAVKRVRERVRGFMADQIQERVALADPALRRAVAERLAGIAMVLLDGSFLAHQIDDSDEASLAARFEQLRWTITLARDALVAEARGGRMAS